MLLFIPWRCGAAHRDDMHTVAQQSDPLAPLLADVADSRRWRRRGRRRRAPRATGSACATPRSRPHLRSGSVALSLYPLAEPRDERRAEPHPPSAPAALSYGVVVRWPPAVAHGWTGLSRPLSLSLGGAARRAPRRTAPAVGAGRAELRGRCSMAVTQLNLRPAVAYKFSRAIASTCVGNSIAQ
jgi:hypothetical protein